MRWFTAIGLLLAATAANAYVGPGLGLGVVGAILGGLATVILAVLGVVWYPLKRLLKKRRRSEQTTRPEQRADETGAQERGAGRNEQA